METIHIALAADQNYVQHAGVTLLSILATHRDERPLSITFLSDGISTKSKATLVALVKKYNASLSFYDMHAAQMAGKQGQGYVSRASYCRLFLPSVLPESVQKIIYLDTDIIVRRDIAQLWDMDIASCHVGAVADKIQPGHLHHFGLSSEVPYFNAGVLLINLALWRNDAIGNKCLHTIDHDSERLLFQDQDALNIHLHNRWMPLPETWNLMKFLYKNYHSFRMRGLSSEQRETFTDPAIVHFIGEVKPWHFACGVPFAEEYMDYCSISPWKGYHFPDISLRSAYHRYRWMLKHLVYGGLHKLALQ